MALLPKTVAPGDDASQSPASSSGSRTPQQPTAKPSRLTVKSPPRIPPDSERAVVCLVSEILLSSLERYAAAPREELTDREARRKRAAEGVGLSQMEAFTQADNDANDEDGGKKEEVGASPFRFEKVISASPRSVAGAGSDQNRKKKAKPSSAGRAMLDEALGRIEEPLALLVASCAAVSSLVEEEDNTHGTVEDETKKALCRLRKQLIDTDVEACLAWVKKSRTLHGIQDNAKRAEQMAVARIATLIVVATICDVFMGTCHLSGDAPDDGAVEDLFGLRCDSIEEAAKIMSSFAVKKKTGGKKKGGEKKKKLKNRNENNSQEDEDGGESPAKKKKAQGKKDDAATAAAVLTRLKSDEVSDAAVEKNTHLLEETVLGLCPALSQEFLAGSIRRFGAGASTKVRSESM